MRGQYMYPMQYVLTERERERERERELPNMYIVYVHSTCIDFNFERNQISVHNSLSNSLSRHRSTR